MSESDTKGLVDSVEAAVEAIRDQEQSVVTLRVFTRVGDLRCAIDRAFGAEGIQVSIECEHGNTSGKIDFLIRHYCITKTN